MDPDSSAMTGSSAAKDTPTPTHSIRFWSVFGALCLISLISSVDATIVTTSLSTITKEIGGEKEYTWIANCYIFASTAPQPMFAQISNIFGRRNPMLLAVSLFALGSGIAGGAKNTAMLIAGRTIQGLGTGGIYVLLDVVCCDLVPLRERGKYLGLMLSTAAIGTTIGPIIGGALADVNWRWVFYLNLPFSGLALLAILLFLNVKYTRSPTWKHALARVDFLGNAIFIPSIIAILLGLVLGGVEFPWNSYHVILPIVLGFLGWALFHVHQASSLCREQSMPPRMFTNRTSATGFGLTFLFSLLLQMVAYFIPVYFQGVRGTTPLRAGIDFLPYTAAIVPFSILAGVLISQSGLYKPLHFAGFALHAVGTGLLTLLDDRSSKAAWACFQIITAMGLGLVMPSVLPAILASLPESDVAVATGAFSFIRSFGFTWGVTVPSIVFNGQVNKFVDRVKDVNVRDNLANGGAYGFASGGSVRNLPTGTKDEVVGIYVDALRTVWQVAIAFSCLGFLCVFIEKHIELRKQLDTEYGLKESKVDASNPEEAPSGETEDKQNIHQEQSERSTDRGDVAQKVLTSL